MGFFDFLGGGPSGAALAAAELLAAMKTGKGPLLVDVREAQELRGPLGALPGVKNIPLSQFAQRIGEIPRDRPVAVICLSGGRSGQAQKFLTAQGYTQVRNVAGGMLAVRAAEGKR